MHSHRGLKDGAKGKFFSLIVYKKAFDLNVEHELHCTKECEPCWKTE